MNTPDLRFKGFEDNWNEKRLGDVCSEFKSGDAIKSQSIEERGLFPVYGGNGLRGFADFYNHDGHYALIGRQGALCGNMNYSKGKAFFTEHAIAVKANSENSTKYLYYLMGVMNLGQYSGQSAQPGLAVGNLIELQSMFPEKREQEEIQNILSTLDAFIEQNQSEVDRLRNLKKAMLLKMFPQKGSKVPEIRFKGFDKLWENHSFKKHVDISTEMVNPTTGEYDDMPHIAPGNIESFTGQILDNVKTVKEEKLISGKFRFRPGDVVYGKINPQLGKYFFARADGLTSADAYVLKGKNGINQEFLYALLQTKDFYDYSVSVSMRSGMPKINREELNEYSFLAPSEEEQKKIGTLLLGIDKQITLQQREISKLKDLKQAMLNKMFVKGGN